MCLKFLKAFNPYYAYNLLVNQPGGFVLLGAVFLCSTGAEALYSDLGHCGRGNIPRELDVCEGDAHPQLFGARCFCDLAHEREFDGREPPFMG